MSKPRTRTKDRAKIQAFLDKVVTSADKAGAMKRLSGWMTRNLRLNGRPYGFKNHEMQKAIASDQHPHKVTTKCSQVGLTELALRIAAAIAGVTRARIIYVLPSARFSEKVSADRFLPIIKDSPILAAMQHTEVKSAAMRKLGNSTVYFVGASGTSQAISIPATHLIIDEENFCDPVVIGQFNSRLRHAEEDEATGIRGVKQRFSTPTIPNYGVSKYYEVSDQKQYHVQCNKCNTWQIPDYYNDYVIPGYDGEIALFEASDLYNRSYKVEDAYVKCQKCGTDLWTSLIDPTRRAWIAKKPDVTMVSGYQVSPIDVPHYNKVPSIFMQLEGYTIQDHRNFVVGLPHEDKNNSFLMSVFDKKEKSQFISIDEAKTMTLSNIRMGMDVGKTSWIVIGKKIASKKELQIIHIAAITSTPDDTIADQAQRYMDAFKPTVTVVDAGPDFSTPQTLIAKNIYGTVFGCEYRRSVPGAYSHIEAIPEDGIVKADRSGTLTDVMALHNKAKIKYPPHPETDILAAHLKATKKITRTGEMGDTTTFPKPSEPDHYCHALNYLNIADVIADDEDFVGAGLGVLPSIKGVTIGGNVPVAKKYLY